MESEIIATDIMPIAATAPCSSQNNCDWVEALHPLAARAKRPGGRTGSPIYSAVRCLGGEDSLRDAGEPLRWRPV